MVEFAIAVPALVVLLYAMMYVADLYMIKAKVLIGARYAAWHLARGNMNRPAVENAVVKNFKFKYDPKYTLSDINEDDTNSSLLEFSYPFRVDEEVQRGLRKLSGKMVSKVAQALKPLLQGGPTTARTIHVELAYPVPIQFGFIDLSEFYKTPLKISGSHHVDGNSWNGCEVATHTIVNMAEAALNIDRNKPIKSIFNTLKSRKPQRQQKKRERKEKLKEAKQNFKEAVQKFKDARQKFRDNKGTRRERIEKLKEAGQNLKEKRAQFKEARQKFKEKREAFREARRGS
ncbi:MAG: hypothetical protein GY868_06560 [Deltaproteobacteria bacterium]|nr:hypothetical protein [Deltaproteobacteria bacterium]